MSSETHTLTVSLDEATHAALLSVAQARGQAPSDVIREALGFTPSLEARITEWLATNDTGASSESLAYALLGHTPRYGCHEPADGADLGRCLRLIHRIPETRAAVDLLAARHASWARLAPHWDELTALGRAAGLLNGPGAWDRAVSARIRQLRWGSR